MARILSYLTDPVAAGRLSRAVDLDAASGAQHEVTSVFSWDDAHVSAEHLAPHLLVFDPFRDAPPLCLPGVRFRGRFPSVGLLPYGEFAGRSHREILALAGLLSVHVVVAYGDDDTPTAFRELLDVALARTVIGVVVDRLSVVVPSDLAPIIRRIIGEAHRPLSPQNAGRFGHWHPNTLRERLRAAGLPPVNKLIVWSRLFHAANLLGDLHRSVDNVAFTLEFPSSSALRNQLQRYASVTPQQVRKGGGVDVLLNRFIHRHETRNWEVSGVGPG